MSREPVWELPFLKALERCGVASEAAAAAGTGVRNAFKRRKANATFAAAWDAAVALHRSEAGRRALSAVAEEGVAYSRGRDGAKLVRAGQSRWSARGEETFLTELTVSASVKRAAAAAGFSTAAVYKRRLKDRRFAAAWDAALETGRARLQAHLVEAANRTFDPDELPIGEGHEVPSVSVSEAINIARLKGPSTSLGTNGAEDEYSATPEEVEAARGRIWERLQRIQEHIAEQERETGCCHVCGQPLPGEPGETLYKGPKARFLLYGPG